MSEQLAIFGGTFNPVHFGHLAVSRAAIALLGLSRLIVVPSATPPHKTVSDLAPGPDRLEMCRLAVADLPGVEVSDIELRRQGPSYTIETLGEFRRLYPGAEIILLVGADMLRSFHLWHRYAEIARLARLVTLPRPDFELGPLPELRRELGEAAVERLLRDVLPTPLVPISSTEVRQRVRAGQPLADLVPAKVADYIHKHHLYVAG